VAFQGGKRVDLNQARKIAGQWWCCIFHVTKARFPGSYR
jgi:hypothetical protein